MELTTAALAGLNSVMYVFWWNKPLDVRCPIVIRTKAVEKMLAERPVEEHEWKFGHPYDFRLFVYLRVVFLRAFSSEVWAFVDLDLVLLVVDIPCLVSLRHPALFH